MRELSACDFCGGDAAGVYEVVPGDIPGVSARRMVLCENCRDTLADIVDPLLEAGRAGGRAESKSESGDATAVGAAAGRTGELAAESGAEGGSESEFEPVAAPEPEPGETEPAPEPESEPEPAQDPESGPESTAAESQHPPRAERPSEYGTVVRLVENRDDGIPRSDLEELATSAYGLSHADVDEAIDFAIEHGTFEETNSGLRTT